MKWVQLKAGNDWGRWYFCPKPLAGKFETADISRGWKFADGQMRTVKFPDGTVYSLTIRTERRTESVSDMGHNYKASSDIPYVVLTHHGLECRVRVDTVGLLFKEYEESAQ